MDYLDKAKYLAKILKLKLTPEEFEMLMDILGDYHTDDWLYEEAARLYRLSLGEVPPESHLPTWHQRLMVNDEDPHP